MELSRHLVEEISRGRVVLFLGAGASIGSKNRGGQNPPLGRNLALSLADRAGIDAVDDSDDLASITAFARKRLGSDAFNTILREQYLHCKSSKSLRALTKFPWFRVYTTNIDDAIEHAFRSSEYRCDVQVHSSPLFDRPTDDGVVQLIKLNGSIDRLEAGLIFTQAEYRSHTGSYGRWYEQVASDFLMHPFLFVGTQLNEPIFAHQVDRLMRARASNPGTSYIVCPSFSEVRRAQFAEENIIAVDGTLDDLAEALAAAIGDKLSVKDLLRAQHPNLHRLMALIETNRLAEIAGQLEELQLVSPTEMERTVPKSSTPVRQFYYGNEPTWRDVLDGVPAELSTVRRLFDAVDGSGRVVVIQGPAGSGKSTAMMQAARRHAVTTPEDFVIWIKGAHDFPIDAIRLLAEQRVSNVIVFVDDYGSHLSELSNLVSENHLHVRYVLSERSNLVPSQRHRLYFKPDQTLSTAKLTEGDMHLILAKLEMFGPWDVLGSKSYSARLSALSAVGEKQLLVGLREATQGIGYDRIAASEFNKIHSTYAQAAYLIVALASMHRMDISIQTFDSAVRSMLAGDVDVPSDRLSGLEDIVYLDGGGLRTRHPILADFTMTRVVPREKALAAVEAIFRSLSRYGSPIRQFANKRETRLFAAVLNHEFLWRMFKAKKAEVLAMHYRWERQFSSDALFLLQVALFEELAGELSSAVNHIRAAMRIFPESFQVVNAFANIHFALAQASSTTEEALMLMEQATAALEDQVQDEVASYTAVALAKGRISVLRKWYPEGLKAEIRSAESRLRDAFGKDPGNRRLQQALNEIRLDAARPAASRADGRSPQGRPRRVRKIRN